MTFDTLDWMMPHPRFAGMHLEGLHLEYTASPKNSKVIIHMMRQNDKIYCTKTNDGYPWDINLFDNNYVYLWITEVDWQNPKTFKKFHGKDASGKVGEKNIRLAKRHCQTGDILRAADSSYELHSDCTTFVVKNLQAVQCVCQGIFNQNLGGNLPSYLPCLRLEYFWDGDPVHFLNFKNREQYDYGWPYGWVRWSHANLQSTGYIIDQESIFNTVVQGTVKPVFPCFRRYEDILI